MDPLRIDFGSILRFLSFIVVWLCLDNSPKSIGYPEYFWITPANGGVTQNISVYSPGIVYYAEYFRIINSQTELIQIKKFKRKIIKINIALITAFTMVSGVWYAASASIPSDRSNSSPEIKHQPFLIAALDCKEWKKRNGDKGKEAATDAPSWVKNEGHRPCKNPNEDGKAFAKRLLDGKYGAGNYKTGAGSEYSQIQKYGDRSFE